MTPGRNSPRARRELREAAEWIAEDSPAAVETLLRAAFQAADAIASRPGLARLRPDLATDRFRFRPLRGFPCVLVLDADQSPPAVARVVHQSRDPPTVLGDLWPPGGTCIPGRCLDPRLARRPQLTFNAASVRRTASPSGVCGSSPRNATSLVLSSRTGARQR